MSAAHESAKKTLLTQIDHLVNTRTFSLDALEGIRMMREGLASTVEKLERTEARRVALDKECIDLRQTVRDQGAIIEGLNTRLKVAEEVADKGRIAIHDAKRSEAVASAYKDIMETIFRPHAVRETIQRNVVKPVEGNPGGNGHYPTAGALLSATESETITRTQA